MEENAWRKIKKLKKKFVFFEEVPYLCWLVYYLLRRDYYQR